jgi:hypothetical protein
MRADPPVSSAVHSPQFVLHRHRFFSANRLRRMQTPVLPPVSASILPLSELHRRWLSSRHALLRGTSAHAIQLASGTPAMFA